MAAFAHSAPCWVDVQLSDLEAGKRFYGGLFGWTFRAGDGMPFADALSGGLLSPRFAAKKDGRMPTAWGVYFATDDIRATVAAIREHGGQIITDPVRAGQAGIVAQAADPGAPSSASGSRRSGKGSRSRTSPAPSAGPRSTPGSRRRWTPSTRRSSASGAPTWTRRATTSPAMPRRWSTSGCGRPRARNPADTAVGGRSVITDAFPAELPSYFLTYFTVADCDAAAELAVQLGGRVSAPPFDIPYGRMAVLHDDQGALFAVLQPSELRP